MSDVAIRVENLSKMYRIGAEKQKFDTMGQAVFHAIGTPFRRMRSLASGQAYGAADLEEEVWALKDINFEVKHGEVLGIIGRNGAGKSTLLKILSRITTPTEGVVNVYGRVGSLLEVGTGFHQELTGRENVYMNAAILGMKRAEINRKFDEIVDFAGVEKFIDTPVKHYSSGMRLRLGFAVAAHLEPEILIVDEVLAVGDAEFQKKCLGKMGDVAGEGRTVIFVSHNMSAVEKLCERGIVLEGGRAIADSEGEENGVAHAISRYLSINESQSNYPIQLSSSDDKFKISIDNVHTSYPENTLLSGEGISIDITYLAEYELNKLDIAAIISSEMGVRVGTLSTALNNETLYNPPKLSRLKCTVSSLPLVPGDYLLGLWCAVNGHTVILEESVTRIRFHGNDSKPTRIRFSSSRQGFVFFDNRWESVE